MTVKLKIPKALRVLGKKVSNKVLSDIDVFNFQVGHNIPESKGGATVIENLRPICSKAKLHDPLWGVDVI